MSDGPGAWTFLAMLVVGALAVWWPEIEAWVARKLGR